MKAFISYAHKDKNYAEMFISEIKEHFGNVDWSLWSDDEIPVGSFWHEEIQDNIKNSNFAILLISASFLNSEYIKEYEFNEFLRLQDEKGFLFFPVLLRDCNFSKFEELKKRQIFMPHGEVYEKPNISNLSYSKLVEFPNGIPSENPNRDTYFVDLVNKLEKAIEIYKKKQNSTPKENLNEINSYILESSKGSKYYNANNKLEEVGKKLSSNKPISIVSLKGIGGVGKSTLAIEYANEALKSGEFKYVVWLGIEKGLYSKLKSFVIEHFLKDDDGKQSDKFYESKLKEFIKENPKTLIILDNYTQSVTTEAQAFIKEFKSNIIITSRQKIKFIATNEVDVDTLSLQASFEMFELNCSRSFNETEEEAIKEIAKLLGGLPLALEISAKFLENYEDISPSEYLEELKAKGLKFFDNTISEDELPELHKQNLRATLQINEKHLQNRDVDLTLLKLFSLLAPEPISKELMVEYIAKELEISSFDIKKSLADLEKYSYIKLKDDSYSMHRLLQEAIRDEYVSDEKKLITSVALAFMKWTKESLDDGKYGKFFDFAFLHCESLLSYSEEFEEVKVYLFVSISIYLQEKSKYSSSLEEIMKAVNLIEKIEVNRDIKHIIFMQYAEVLRYNGKYREAIENNLKALEIVNKINLKDISNIYNNLGLIYENLEEYNKAIEYYQKSLKIKLDIFGENHNSSAIGYGNLASIYSKLKDYDKAIEHYQKSLKINLNFFGEEHKDIATVYNDLGLIYANLKKHHKAIGYYTKSLNIYKNVLGEYHLYTSISYNNLGISFYYKKEYFQSFKYLYEAIKVRINLEKTSPNKLEIKNIIEWLVEIRDNHLTRSTPQEKQSINKMIDEINKLLKEKKIKKVPKLNKL